MKAKTVNEMKSKINALNAQIWKIENNITDKNSVTLAEEIANLIHGVGKGFVEGDYYAPSRYYSRIPGVKNIRAWARDKNAFLVKITSPSGELLPQEIVVGGEKVSIVIGYSSKYTDEVDY